MKLVFLAFKNMENKRNKNNLKLNKPFRKLISQLNSVYLVQ